MLGTLEAKLVVPKEAGSADGEGEVAESETYIGQEVRLREGYAIQIGGNCVVRGVFEVLVDLVDGTLTVTWG